MANYNGVTASTTGIIKKGKVEECQEYLNGWGFTGDGEIKTEIGIKDRTLNIYGYDDFDPHTLATKDDPDNYIEVGDINYEDGKDGEDFLMGLAPFLEPIGEQDGKEFLMVVQSVGYEKCRFPLGSVECVLFADGTVGFTNFKH